MVSRSFRRYRLQQTRGIAPQSGPVVDLGQVRGHGVTVAQVELEGDVVRRV